MEQQIDGVTLVDGMDYDAAAQDILRGASSAQARPEDGLPLDWFCRNYPLLVAMGSPHAGRLAAGVAGCLAAPEPLLRYQALLFFERFPSAPGAGRIDIIVRGDRAGFAGVRIPESGSADLEWQLLRALGARALAGAGDTPDLARREVLLPGKALGVIAAVGTREPEFLAAHAEDIVRGTPAALGPLLYRVQRAGLDVVAIGRRLATLGVVAPAAFRAVVADVVRDPAARARILEGCPASH